LLKIHRLWTLGTSLFVVFWSAQQLTKNTEEQQTSKVFSEILLNKKQHINQSTTEEKGVPCTAKFSLATLSEPVSFSLSLYSQGEIPFFLHVTRINKGKPLLASSFFSVDAPPQN